MTSKRKPLNDTAGYVASRKCVQGGYVMVIDRKNGGDWIDADTRWVVCKHDANLAGEAILEMDTKAHAIQLMKDTAEGYDEWYSDAVPA